MPQANFATLACRFLAPALAVGLLACSAPSTSGPAASPGPWGGASSAEEAAAIAQAATKGEVLAFYVRKETCRPGVALGASARQPNGKVFEYHHFGWSPAGAYVTTGGQIFLGADGALYIESGEPRTGFARVGSYQGPAQKEAGATLSVSLDAGARWLAGYPEAPHNDMGWLTIKAAAPTPAPLASVAFLPSADLSGTSTCTPRGL